MTKKVLQILAVALAGYAIYELVWRYLSDRQSLTERVRHLESMGQVRGAALTGRGQGQTQQTQGSDGSTLSERVGRGVVRRGE